ncbi:MAG: glycosyltransferase [Blastomonas sp.]
MSQEARLSVLMSVRNGEPYLANAIDSVLGQTEGRFRFLIVNDGSTDNSAAMLDRFARQDRRIRIYHRENQGLVASLNFLLEQADTPLIARMDADDISLPERFARQMAFLDVNPDISVLGTNNHELDEQGRFRVNRHCYPETHDDICTALLSCNPISHPTTMMRRDAMLAMNGYRAQFRHCEDYDLWLRLSQHYRLANLPDRLLLYRRSPGQVTERHNFASSLGSAYALLAARERLAGRPDPFAGMTALPPIDALDGLTGQPGMGQAMRTEIIDRVKYSRSALADPALKLMVEHLHSGGEPLDLWRTAGRMVKLGLAGQATRLALALLRHAHPPSLRAGPV